MEINRKSFFAALLFCLLFATASIASPLATFNYKIFYIPGKGPVVETYFDISGKSIVLADDGDGKLSGKVEITLIFKKGEEIVTYDKKVLESPEMSASDIIDFLDIQRFALEAGNYDLEIQLLDALDPMDVADLITVPIRIPPSVKGVFISDLELVSAFKKTEEPGTFSKSGYDILPMVNDDYLNAGMNELVVYAEVYGANTGEVGEMFLVSTYLEDTLTGKPVASSIKNMRRDAAEVNPVMARIPIGDVKTGQYNVIVEARNRENEVLARKSLSVFRMHPGNAMEDSLISEADISATWTGKYEDKATLYEHYRSLRPIATENELVMMNNSFADYNKLELQYLQRYFYSFWKLRDEADSEGAWLKYREQVKIAQEKFGTANKRGYEADRGRVFLRYGPPNDITNRANEPSSYPYQIWRYYKADRWNNVKFVFYDPSLLAVDYELLHCEYIPGEIQNPQWKVILEKRNTPLDNIDRTQGRDHFGGRIDDYYNNPR